MIDLRCVDATGCALGKSPIVSIDPVWPSPPGLFWSRRISVHSEDPRTAPPSHLSRMQQRDQARGGDARPRPRQARRLCFRRSRGITACGATRRGRGARCGDHWSWCQCSSDLIAEEERFCWDIPDNFGTNKSRKELEGSWSHLLTCH